MAITVSLIEHGPDQCAPDAFPLMRRVHADGKQVGMTRRHIVLMVSLEAVEGGPDFVGEGEAKVQWQPEKADAQQSPERECILARRNADDNTSQVCRDRHVAIEIAVADVAAEDALEPMAPSRIGNQVSCEGIVEKRPAEEIACAVDVFGFEGHKRHSPINEDFSTLECLPATFHWPC